MSLKEIIDRINTNYSLYKLCKLSRAKLSVPKNNTLHGPPVGDECTCLFRTCVQYKEVMSRNFLVFLNVVRKYENFFIKRDDKLIFNILPQFCVKIRK